MFCYFFVNFHIFVRFDILNFKEINKNTVTTLTAYVRFATDIINKTTPRSCIINLSGSFFNVFSRVALNQKHDWEQFTWFHFTILYHYHYIYHFIKINIFIQTDINNKINIQKSIGNIIIIHNHDTKWHCNGYIAY